MSIRRGTLRGLHSAIFMCSSSRRGGVGEEPSIQVSKWSTPSSLAGAPSVLVATQLIERRVNARRRERRRAEALLQALGKLISVAGSLDHEAQDGVLRRHAFPSPRGRFNQEGIPNAD